MLSFHTVFLTVSPLRYKVVWIVLCYSLVRRGMPVLVCGFIFTVWVVTRGYSAGSGNNRRREAKVEEEHVKGKPKKD